jgi:hypothetical protein
MSLAMKFAPSVEAIAATHRFVSDVAIEHLCDGDWTSRVALAVQELLENAIKYSVDGNADMSIDIVPDDDAALISVRVSCRGQATHASMLRGLMREIAEATDPMAYYVDVMRRCAHRTDGSGLGLARIRAEADMDLSAEFDGDDVCVLAQARVAGLRGRRERGIA